MLKNTKEKMTVKNLSIGRRVFLTSGVVLTSFCLSLPVRANSDTMDSEFNKYASIYFDASKKINDNNFNHDFEKFYNTGTVNIEDKEYSIKELYIKTMDNNENYLTKAGEQKDLLTSLPISGEKKSTLAFRKASILYDIYEDGYISDNTLEINKEKLKEYLDNWNLQEQSEVAELKIEQEADKEYQEQYGKKG